MPSIDDIINKYSMVKPEDLKNALVTVNENLVEFYDCDDGFLVEYRPAKGTAVYSLNGHALETPVSEDQKNYFVKSKYWRVK